MSQSVKVASERAGQTSAERYTSTLEEWRRISEGQLTALESADWDAFGRLSEQKLKLRRSWERRGVDVAALFAAADDVTRANWERLSADAVDLGVRLERIVEHLLGQVQEDQRELSAMRRVTRAYRSMPREFTPSFHDKEY